MPSDANHRYFRSKTVAAALAFFFGCIGAHRFYLYGRRDPFAWLHAGATLVGVPGLLLLIATQRGSATGWVLTVPGAVSLIAAFLTAIAYGLRPDERWDAHFNGAQSRCSQSGWAVIFVVIFSLLTGAFLLMAGLALTFQTYFEARGGADTSLPP